MAHIEDLARLRLGGFRELPMAKPAEHDTPTGSNTKKYPICLFAIVRDEADKIRRMLDSTLGHVTHYCITDTGSTDGTPELMRAWFAEHHQDGKVVCTTWPEHFGEARTTSYKNACEFMAERGYPGYVWFLTIDADHTLVRLGDQYLVDYDFPADTKCAWIEQRDHTQVYENIRMIFNKYPWECVEPTHEYWTTTQLGKHEEHIRTVFIHDHNDGSSHSVKEERDIRYYKADLRVFPNKERSWHYLGQTYFGMGRWEEAKEAYLRRTQLGGYYMEKFISWMRIGDCWRHLNNNDEAAKAYFAAYSIAPSRAEVPLRIAKLFLDRAFKNEPGLYETAFHWLKIARKCKLSNVRDNLFVEWSAYTSELDLVTSLCYFRTDKMDKAYMHNDRALLCPHTGCASAAANNVQYYIKKLPCQMLRLNHPARLYGWNSMNPSVVWDPKYERYNVILRMVNYFIEHNGSYSGYGTTVRTRNFWQIYTVDWDYVGSWEIIPETAAPFPSDRVKGLEDMRLFRDAERWYATASSWEYNDIKTLRPSENTNNGTVQQVLVEFTDVPLANTPTEKLSETSWSTATAVRVRVVGLKSPTNADCEKNWLMISPTEAIHSIGDGSVRLTQLVAEASEVTPTLRKQPRMHKLNTGSMRNSAGPIEFEYQGTKGKLFVVHEVNARSGRERFYWHRWVLTDDDYKILFISYPFNFIHQGIEYVLGLSASADSSELVLGVGWRDYVAYIARVKKSDIAMNPVSMYAYPDLEDNAPVLRRD